MPQPRGIKKCTLSMEVKLRKAIKRGWRLKLQFLDKNELAMFFLHPPKNSVARKNQWACIPERWIYRDQFIVNVPCWFVSRPKEAEEKWKQV